MNVKNNVEPDWNLIFLSCLMGLLIFLNLVCENIFIKIRNKISLEMFLNNFKKKIGINNT